MAPCLGGRALFGSVTCCVGLLAVSCYVTYIHTYIRIHVVMYVVREWITLFSGCHMCSVCWLFLATIRTCVVMYVVREWMGVCVAPGFRYYCPSDQIFTLTTDCSQLF